jgi:hypothetical protein
MKMVFREVRAVAATLCLLSVLTSATSGFATVILVAVRPDGMWIGADGQRGPDNWSNVCKLHETYGGVLLKFGLNNDDKNTISSDDDIQRLLQAKKSFAEFQPAAADILRSRVDVEVEEILAEQRTAHPEAFIGDTMSLPPNLADDAGVEMGLAFVTVVDGKLAVYELFVDPTTVTITQPDGSFRYRWIVEKPTWHLRESKEEVINYPRLPPGMPLRSSVVQGILAEPEVQIPSLISWEELHYPCLMGSPNVLIKVTPPVLDPGASPKKKKKLIQHAVIEYLDHGACPSWKPTPIARPAACTDQQLKRMVGAN